MVLRTMLAGSTKRSAWIYLAIGGISLIKAIALRNDDERFRRELLDAGVYIGLGLLLRRYGEMARERSASMRERVPEPLHEPLGIERADATDGIRNRARNVVFGP